MVEHIAFIKRFNVEINKNKRIEEFFFKTMDRYTFSNLFSRRVFPDPIVKVWYTKPKEEKIVTMCLT